MATTNETTTKTATASELGLELTPPDPVPTVVPEKAAGLVAIDSEKKSALEQKVDGFVAELVALDAQSPEFGKKVDQITGMGRKEITTAAGICAMVDLLVQGKLPQSGFVRQEQAALPDFLANRFGSYYA